MIDSESACPWASRGAGFGISHLVVEQRVAVLAALVGELGDRGYPLVVVRLHLPQRLLDPLGRARAERLRDVALLTRRLHAVLLEDPRHAREDRDLRVDVGDGVGQPLLLELPQLDVLAMLAQLALGHRAEPLDLTR